MTAHFAPPKSGIPVSLLNGTASFEDGLWTLNLSPNVAMRFKHVFRSIKAEQTSPFKIRDRDDLGVELDWFFSRFPVELDAPARKRLKASLRESRKREEFRLQVMSPDWTPGPIVGFKEGEGPFPFQSKAAALALSQNFLLLLDEVGLGKTISAITAIIDGGLFPAAVVVQPHLSEQWVIEYINEFTHLRAHEIKTTTPGTVPEADIYIFRYSNISGWADHIPTMGFKAVVFDEIQELRRGAESDKGLAASAFLKNPIFVMGLSATPIFNYGSEIFNIVEYVRPGFLGTRSEFHTEWCHRKETHWVVTDPDALGAHLEASGISLRRDENHPEVKEQRPPPNKLLIEVDWNSRDVQSDIDLQKSLAMRVLKGSFTERGQASRELDMMLRQETGIAKARSVAAYTRMLIESGEPVLLAGWHREVYRIWKECLGDLNPLMYTGSETAAKKRAAKLAFCAGESSLMMMSLRSGSGLDGLQHRCSHIVIGEFDWSPMVTHQIIGRLRRRGQPKIVTAHFLHVDGGSDPAIIEVNGLKAAQSRGILAPYQALPHAESDESRMKALAMSVLGIQNMDELNDLKAA